MLEKEFFEEVSQKISAIIPDSLKSLKGDLEKNMYAILQTAFARLDLISRDEFDIQANVLKKTRMKLEELEKRVNVLEKELNINRFPSEDQ